MPEKFKVVDPLADLDSGASPAPVVSSAPPTDMIARDGGEALLAGESREAKLDRLRRAAEELGIDPSTLVLPEDAEAEARRKQELHDQALALGRQLAEGDLPLDETNVGAGTETILMHFIEDGFTALGQMWHRGQELEFVIERDQSGKVIGGPAYLATVSRTGKSWVDLVDNEMEQVRRYGKILFRRGPWPGLPWPDDAAAQEERKRARKPPVPSALARARTR